MGQKKLIDLTEELHKTYAQAEALQRYDRVLADSFPLSSSPVDSSAFVQTLYELAEERGLERTYIDRALTLRSVPLELASIDAELVGAEASRTLQFRELLGVFFPRLQEVLHDEKIVVGNFWFSREDFPEGCFTVGYGKSERQFEPFIMFPLFYLKKVVVMDPALVSVHSFFDRYKTSTFITNVTLHDPLVLRICGEALKEFQESYPDFSLAVRREYSTRKI